MTTRDASHASRQINDVKQPDATSERTTAFRDRRPQLSLRCPRLSRSRAASLRAGWSFLSYRVRTVPPDEGWMERRQAHSFFRSRLRRATTLSRGDRDPSRRSTVAVFGCGPTKPAPGSGTGAASDCPRQAITAWRSGSGPPYVAVRAASAGRHSPLRLQDRL